MKFQNSFAFPILPSQCEKTYFLFKLSLLESRKLHLFLFKQYPCHLPSGQYLSDSFGFGSEFSGSLKTSSCLLLLLLLFLGETVKHFLSTAKKIKYFKLHSILRLWYKENFATNEVEIVLKCFLILWPTIYANSINMLLFPRELWTRVNINKMKWSISQTRYRSAEMV